MLALAKKMQRLRKIINFTVEQHFAIFGRMDIFSELQNLQNQISDAAFQLSGSHQNLILQSLIGDRDVGNWSKTIKSLIVDQFFGLNRVVKSSLKSFKSFIECSSGSCCLTLNELGFENFLT